MPRRLHGDGDIERGERGDMRITDFDGVQARPRFILTPDDEDRNPAPGRSDGGLLRSASAAPRRSPDDLHSTNLIIGLDTNFPTRS